MAMMVKVVYICHVQLIMATMGIDEEVNWKL